MTTTTTQAEAEPRAIFSADGKAWTHDEGAGPVVKIVIGTPPIANEEAKPIQLAGQLRRDLAAHLPTITHLHLWQVQDLETLDSLPAGLKCLDLRGCAPLKSLPELPAGLDTLLVDGCSLLTAMQLPAGGLPALRDAGMAGCTALQESAVNALLSAAPGLRRLDASDCPLIECIEEWPPALERIDLNGCAALTAMPGAWPAALRRLGLRGATALSELGPMPAAADYVDLAHMERLRELPEFERWPRTLFLFGSGILKPPASEHGTGERDNVAARTRSYFDDAAIVGMGAVKRCKLLFLGNGSAGKTCLSLALQADRDPLEARTLGTTHAVRFDDWSIRAPVGARMENVHLNLWDFGGQEIYHNTHGLFMSKGSVFVVVWQPDQDGRQPDRTPEGYQDEWRPLRYWLDYIHLACPHRPRIAVVCSHHTVKTDVLESRWRSHVDPERHGDVKCFYVDSETRGGQLEDLRKWLKQAIGEVVQAQGTQVPIHWEIAQDMVSAWLQSPSAPNEMTRDEFRKRLAGALQDNSADYPQLRAALEHETFELTDDRIHQTLEFLTHSGWLYWDEKLFEGRVIVGQQWALDGIYTVLDRRPSTFIHRVLTETDGRFTLHDLHEAVWSDKYSAAEQQLLVSFMEQCRLCFRLRRAEDAWRERDVYVSFEHLPSAKVARLEHEFDSRYPTLGVEARPLKAPRLHRGHWQNFLIECGRTYGASAQYARDGLYVENRDGQLILILCRFHEGGLGADIEIRIKGEQATERIQAAVSFVQSFLPGASEPAPPAEGAIGPRADVVEVFISYAWDPPENAGESGIPPGYAEPVDAIEQFLKGRKDKNDRPARLIRDKNDATFGANLRQFMEYGARRPHVIVVHSDRYWKSACCIFELWTVMDGLRKKTGKDVLSVVIPVEHHDSGITVQEKLREYLEHWDINATTPALIGWTPGTLRDHARSLLRTVSDDMSNLLHLNIHWSDGREEALAKIAKRLELATDTPPDADLHTRQRDE